MGPEIEVIEGPKPPEKEVSEPDENKRKLALSDKMQTALTTGINYNWQDDEEHF